MQIKRRVFIQAGALGAAALFSGCGSDASEVDGGPDPDAPPNDANVTHDASACQPTEPNIEGPFYEPGAPERSVLVTPEMPGTRLTLNGRVIGQTTCMPLAGATVDVWQADANGDYDLNGFTLRGLMTTNSAGAFELITIIPGHYLNGAMFRPAHLHIKAIAPGHRLLTTQLYFEGDEFNAIDPFIDESLIMALSQGPGGVTLASYDLVLSPLAAPASL